MCVCVCVLCACVCVRTHAHVNMRYIPSAVTVFHVNAEYTVQYVCLLDSDIKLPGLLSVL